MAYADYMLAVNRLVREQPFGWYDEQYPGGLLSCWRVFVLNGDIGEVAVDDVLCYREGLSTFLSFRELERFDEFHAIKVEVSRLDEILKAKLRQLGKNVSDIPRWWIEIDWSEVEEKLRGES